MVKVLKENEQKDNSSEYLNAVRYSLDAARRNVKNFYAICYAVRYGGYIRISDSGYLFSATSAEDYRKKVEIYCNGKDEHDFTFYTVYNRQ